MRNLKFLAYFLNSMLMILTLMTMGCSSHNNGGTSPTKDTSGQVQLHSNLKINLNEVSSIQAENVFRPGIVAYGLLASDKTANYFGLQQYTTAARSKGGYVQIDELSSLLRSINSVDQLAGQLAAIDEAVSLAISGGSKVVLILNCMLPHAVSKFEGFHHDVISGLNTPSGQPIYSCAAIKNTSQARATWAAMMEQTASFFSKYNNDVVFIIGNEPETYFAGNSNELFDLFEVTANGLRAGNAQVRIGGLTPHDYKLSFLDHTAPVYKSASDSFTFSKETLSKPLLQLWLEYLHTKNISIDVIQTKKFGGSPSPASAAFWIEAHTQLESWLQANPNSYKDNVELIYADFPGWHTVCAENASGERESIWDSEYFSSWYASTYISMKSYIMNKNGVINNIEPLLGYLIEYGTSAFFHTSCEPDKSKPAGFSGAMGLFTEKSKLPKPIFNSLNLLTGLSGSIVAVEQNDPNISAIAAYDANQSQISVLISHFVPSELNYHTAGYVGYDWGEVFDSKYGYQLNMADLKNLPPNPDRQKYLDDPDYPKMFVKDLLSGSGVLDIYSLGLPQNFIDYFTAASAAGQLNRKIIDQSKNGIQKALHFHLSNLPAGEYTLVHQVVDQEYGNAYTQRTNIHTELEAAFARGGTSELNLFLQKYRDEFGISSTFVAPNKEYSIQDSLNLDITARPNSVHLLILKRK